MKTYRLFHLARPETAIRDSIEMNAYHDAALLGRVGRAVDCGLYREVALVQSPTIDQIFPLTNHIDWDWTENEGVLQHADRCRSTSIGDIVLDVETGSLHACVNVGWKQLSVEAETIFRRKLGEEIEELQGGEDPSP